MSENDKYVYETFNQLPRAAASAESSGDHFAAAAATDGAENVLLTDRNIFEYHIISPTTPTGAAAAPTWDANGLDLAFNQTDDEGAEITSASVNGARGRNVFTVGTDDDFFLRVHFDINDVSGTDDCAVGFRKLEAYQAAIDSYDEMACLNVISGNVTIETILNDATATSTDTTENWLDTEDHKLTVRVSKGGVVTFEFDDAAASTTAAFTFDSGEVVIPFMYLLNAANLCDNVYIRSWECGYQTARGSL
jgi:hypothetical protein